MLKKLPIIKSGDFDLSIASCLSFFFFSQSSFNITSTTFDFVVVLSRLIIDDFNFVWVLNVFIDSWERWLDIFITLEFACGFFLFANFLTSADWVVVVIVFGVVRVEVVRIFCTCRWWVDSLFVDNVCFFLLIKTGTKNSIWWVSK